MFVNTNSERQRMRESSSAKITVEDQLSVYSLLADAAARAPQATAITFLPSMDSEPIRLTHGAFLSRLHRMARLFRGLGVARGDVVTLLAPNIPDAVVALWAAEAIGIAHRSPREYPATSSRHRRYYARQDLVCLSPLGRKRVRISGTRRSLPHSRHPTCARSSRWARPILVQAMCIWRHSCRARTVPWTILPHRRLAAPAPNSCVCQNPNASLLVMKSAKDAA